jgi:hypothetical protein
VGETIVASSVETAGVPAGPWYLRRRSSALVLAAALFLLAQLPDPGGYLSTDVGGKTATIEVIVEEGPRAPDLGYWAEAYDPDGSLYPMWSTAQVGDSWVNVSTLPMLYVAAPLWRLGGARLAILVPVLGAVLAAAAAAAIAGRIGGDRARQSAVFWIVGLGSPATIYALDFWEHSLGLGLILWGMVAVLDAGASKRVSLLMPFLSGVAFASAASMRQEALVYGFVAGLALVVGLVLQGRPLTAVLRGAAMMVGTGVALGANALFEWWVFGTTLRAGRVGGTAAAAGTDLAVRVEEAIVTGVAPMAGTSGSALLLAAVLLALLIMLGVRAHLPGDQKRLIWAGLAVVGLLVVLDLIIDGMRFIPGLVATTPLAVLGAVRGWQAGPRRVVTTVALAALPIVWFTQFAGGASAQWGGRYTLPSAVMLVVVAVVAYDHGRALVTMRGVAAVGLAVTVVGVGWIVMRTHAFADAGEALADRPEEVLVFRDPFLAREPGPLVLGEQWLAAPTDELLREASAVLLAAGIERVGYVDYDIGRAAPALPGYEPVDESTIPLVNDLRLRVVSLRRAG